MGCFAVAYSAPKSIAEAGNIQEIELKVSGHIAPHPASFWGPHAGPPKSLGDLVDLFSKQRESNDLQVHWYFIEQPQGLSRNNVTLWNDQIAGSRELSRRTTGKVVFTY